MSELKVNKVSPRSGTNLTIGDSGDTTNIVGTLNNNGSALLSLANGVDNRVITSSSANALNGEANLTFDGSTLGVNGAAIFNESGADKDFRVESDGNANMLFVDGGTNRVGIGTASPSEVLEVVGTVKATTGLTVISSGTEANLRLQNSTTGSGGSDGLLIQATGSDVYINNYENADMYFRTNNTDRLKLHENGILSAAQGIALGVGTANTASNVLDDYEEGTFTPAITVASGSVTNNTQTGNYTKIGRLAYFDIRVSLSAISSPSGTLTITGLPFTGGISGRAGLVKFTTVSNFNSITPADVLSTYISTGTSFGIGKNDGTTYPATNLASNTQFDVSGMYQTN